MPSGLSGRAEDGDIADPGNCGHDTSWPPENRSWWFWIWAGHIVAMLFWGPFCFGEGSGKGWLVPMDWRLGEGLMTMDEFLFFLTYSICISDAPL